MRFALAALMYFTIAGALSGQVAPQKMPAPKVHVVCHLDNHPYTVSHYDKSNNKLNEEEIDDWRVDCEIEVGKHFYQKCDVVATHPVSFHDAMVAVDEFRTKTAPQLVKDKALTLDKLSSCQ
jgi:hypothetical protein